MHITGEAYIQCPGCKANAEVHLMDNQSTPLIVKTFEKNLGTELWYSFQAHVVCDSCFEENPVTVLISEYPSLQHNFSHCISIEPTPRNIPFLKSFNYNFQ